MKKFLEILETLDKKKFFEWLIKEGELAKWEAALDEEEIALCEHNYIKWRIYNDYLTVTVLNFKNHGQEVNNDTTMVS